MNRKYKCLTIMFHVWINLSHELHFGDKMHPEKPQRINAILNSINKLSGIQFIPKVDPFRFHGKRYLTWSMTEDGDTYQTPFTEQIVKFTQDIIREAVEIIIMKSIRSGFILIRPPGHHSSNHGPKGFCFQNNIWTAVQKCIQFGWNHISILDWDAHHGDGTEALVLEHTDRYPHIKFASLHAFGHGIYPGTGLSTRTNNILNIPLDRGTSQNIYLEKFRNIVLPFLGNPDIILVSAGYDGHIKDPMQLLKLSEETYQIMSQELKSIGCPVLFILEGGYNCDVLGACVKNTILPWIET